MKHFKKMLLLATAMTMFFAFAATANAEMVKKIDNFILFLDQSGSMAMTYEGTNTPKIDMAKETLTAMNKAIPELGYTSSMVMFAPFEVESKTGTYNKSVVGKAVHGLPTDFDIFNRRTPLGNGLMDLDPIISGLSGNVALIIFTDGRSNIGADPIAQAKALYAKYGDKLCIHVVSYADTPQGQMVIDELRALSSCSVVADYASLMAPGGMDAYVGNVFYTEAAAPKAPVVAAQAETITFSLHFGFDKYEITDEMIPVLEQVQIILEESPNAMFEIAGHTDSTGTEAYNQGLSERRAAAVKGWLTKVGVPAAQLEAKGYGEMAPKYDNGTKEGRKLNRRVEIVTK